MKYKEVITVENVRETYKTGVNIQRNHYRFLRLLSRRKFGNDITLCITHLLEKYYFYLLATGNAKIKKTFTASYQPRSKAYIRYKISVDPLLWQRLFDLRKQTGYSISFLLRILIEWEMTELGFLENPLILKPVLPEHNFPLFPENITFSTISVTGDRDPEFRYRYLKSYAGITVMKKAQRKVQFLIRDEFS